MVDFGDINTPPQEPPRASDSREFTNQMRIHAQSGIHARMRANSHPFSLTVVSYWRLFDTPGFEALTLAVFFASFGAFNTILHLSAFSVEEHVSFCCCNFVTILWFPRACATVQCTSLFE